MIARDELNELGRAWLQRQLEPLTRPTWQVTHRKGGEPDPSIEQERLKFEADVAAVHAAFLDFMSEKEQEEIALSADDVTKIERTATESARRPQKADRTRYLFWLLRQLEGARRLTFRLPVVTRDLPPRSLVFDALDPHLPTMTRFLAWQHHISSRVLDLRPLRKRQPLPPRERELLTSMTLLVFGGLCGRQALTGLAQIQVRDFELAQGTLWLRNTEGNRSLNLTLHPVQALAFAVYARSVGPTEPGARLFPSLSTKRRRRTFQKRVAQELASADATLSSDIYSKHCAPPGFHALLSGARRWMLEIYPPFLVSVLAGRFRTSTIPDEKSKRPKLTRRRGTRGGSRAVPMSKGEGELRAKLRAEMSRYLGQGRNYRFGTNQAKSVSLLWERLDLLPESPPPPERRSERARRWNLALIAYIFLDILSEMRTDRYKTVERWFSTCCSILDELGGRPVWTLDEDEREGLSRELEPGEARLVLELIGRMTKLAPKYGLQHPLPLDCDASISDGPQQAAMHISHKVTSVARAIDTPTPEQIEKMVARLITDAERAGEGRAAEQARLLRLYLDLLALGLRKGEAEEVRVDDVDVGRGGSDLIIRGTKIKAAYRLIPLENHPHQGSVRRIIKDARHFAKERFSGIPLLDAAGRIEHLRRPREDLPHPQYTTNWMHCLVDKLSSEDDEKSNTLVEVTVAPQRKVREWRASYNSVDQFNRALVEIGERVGLDDLTPHVMRHASISNSLTDGVEPERIAKYHGHVDLPTTFQHYVHGLSGIQKQNLQAFLKRKENSVWIAEADARGILGVSKQSVNKRFAQKIKVLGKSTLPGMVLRRSGRNYISAIDLAGAL